MKLIICAVTVLLSFGPASALINCYACSTHCDVMVLVGTAAGCGACGTTIIFDNVAVRTARRVCYPTTVSCNTAEVSAATSNKANAGAGISTRTTVTCCGFRKCNDGVLPSIGAKPSGIECYECSSNCETIQLTGGTRAGCNACGTTLTTGGSTVLSSNRTCYSSMSSCSSAQSRALTSNAGYAASGSSKRIKVKCCNTAKCNNDVLVGAASSISPTFVGLLASLFLAYSNL